ncbi:hypothetical protein GGI21_001357 [Coemansia aciculifera]|nr:hypothetical protein GGI21_001357 [Coemansia aciculifera]
MHGQATPDNRLSIASSSGYSVNHRHSVVSLPPQSRRPASVVIAHANSPLSPAASPRHSQALPSELSAAVHSDEPPAAGFYAYRRRGSSFLGNDGTISSSSSSSTTSPASPATPKEYRYSYAPGHLAYNQHQTNLQRNNTTKTISHNDLGVPKSSAGHIRHLSPSRSATFATSASSPHEYQRRAYGYQSPVRDSSICTLVEHGSSVQDEVTMIHDKSERAGNICDDVDVVVPNVCAIGKQFAYLPPRTANFSITN